LADNVLAPKREGKQEEKEELRGGVGTTIREENWGGKRGKGNRKNQLVDDLRGRKRTGSYSAKDKETQKKGERRGKEVGRAREATLE